jgi:hypothetical protein
MIFGLGKRKLRQTFPRRQNPDLYASNPSLYAQNPRLCASNTSLCAPNPYNLETEEDGRQVIHIGGQKYRRETEEERDQIIQIGGQRYRRETEEEKSQIMQVLSQIYQKETDLDTPFLSHQRKLLISLVLFAFVTQILKLIFNVIIFIESIIEKLEYVTVIAILIVLIFMLVTSKLCAESPRPHPFPAYMART